MRTHYSKRFASASRFASSYYETEFFFWTHSRYLAPIWVLPEYKGLGVGSLLIEQVIALADEHTPSTPIYLEASAEGKPWYSKLGFEVKGDSEYVEVSRRGES